MDLRYKRKDKIKDGRYMHMCRLPSPEKMRRMQTTQYPSLVETTCRRSLLDSIKIKVHIAFLFTSDPFIQRGFSIT